MDNRKSNRETKQINVRLYQGDTFVALAKTLDITTGGMFIHTNVLRFPKHSSLDVVFDSPVDDSIGQSRYAATVVHRCLNGIGISLSDKNALNEHLLCEKPDAIY
ncbi:MAG: PilZ domain-containing protein [Gammaproteobacteria bacterium]|nr:PilZ domain-containing protein [Gammaproteobacteria bacterium]